MEGLGLWGVSSAAMRPLDCVIFARGRLQVSRPQTDGVLEHLCRIEGMLNPTCRDTVSAVEELRAVVRELEQLPKRPPIGRAQGFRTLFQDSTPQPLSGVTESIAMLRSAALELERA